MVNNMTSEELVKTLYIAAELQEESIALKYLLIVAAEKITELENRILEEKK